MRKLFYPIAVISFGIILSGCTTTKPVNNVTIEQVKLTVVEPRTKNLSLKEVKWKVYNKEELIKLVKDLENTPSSEISLLALDPNNFERLTLNLNELRRYIEEQKEVILYYRKITKDQ